ncbi:pyrroline-5-carboxylate reductase family protein [Raineyella fluvialis]|uniref:Pyrroline-5-carboxylate reductase catalytic N-terminal domain-containing protein n=1 Tax=Raineyella fluvialis TaxID=2662261 RepID=A0A5Q2FAX4_9ACTN|nr:NAD(P)-binding domain-containing protein [Raineyella fluvialis]QGF23949.1 hypothetical protein Rai3103_09975 [Raineyella fluvialis]
MDHAPADLSALTVAVIGGGVMGGTLFRAILAVDDPGVAGAVVAETHAGRRADLLEDVAGLVAGRDVRATEDALEAARGADVVVLAVKPQDARATLASIAGELGPRTLLLSICAGLSTATLEGWVPRAYASSGGCRTLPPGSVRGRPPCAPDPPPTRLISTWSSDCWVAPVSSSR